MLTYHKSLNTTNASRWPVRFLLPEVGELLIRYLILIQPFRRWLCSEVSIPAAVLEYLRSSGKKTWPEDRMTRVLQSQSSASIGVSLSVQGWRQIATGIAIKKMKETGAQLNLEQYGNTEAADQTSNITTTVPDAIHWQTSHAPRIGNAVYGGTVNFRNGPTDAGLQEYRYTSQLWHKLCTIESRESSTLQTTHGRDVRKRAREDSLSSPVPQLL